MSDYSSEIWNDPTTQQLVDSIRVLSEESDLKAFLRDVMTDKEIIELSSRLQAAKMLRGGSKYAEINYRTKLSSRTIARISDWLRNGNGGYDIALSKMSEHHQHPKPARAS